MNKKAFTLLELLIVIVILGILIAVLLPAMGKMREQARIVLCMNNMRQIGVAWHLYLDDHNERFPKFDPTMFVLGSGEIEAGSCDEWTYGGKAGTDSSAALPAKQRVLNPYLGVDVSKDAEDVEKDPSLGVFRCPSDLNRNGQASRFDQYGNSYMLNPYILRYNIGDGYRPLLSITAPFSKLMLSYEDYHIGDDYENGLYNVLFLDGHVKRHKEIDFDYSFNDINDPSKDVYFDPTQGNGTYW